MVHEIGHALGIGTSWFATDPLTTSLYRSFVVGAGDNSVNDTYGTAGNIFYTAQTGARAVTDVISSASRNNPSLSSTFLTKGDSTYSVAWDGYSSRNQSVSFAVSAYNEAFGTSLTAIPIENQLRAGSYGGHWDEGAHSFGDIVGPPRQYLGQTYPGALPLIDELMTPIIALSPYENPLSKITLGALADLGWGVDYSKADEYKPLTFGLRLSSTNDLMIQRNNFGIYIPSNNYFLSIRKGVTYTLKNETNRVLQVEQFDSSLGNSIVNRSSVLGPTTVTNGLSTNTLFFPTNFVSSTVNNGQVVNDYYITYVGNTGLNFYFFLE